MCALSAVGQEKEERVDKKGRPKREKQRARSKPPTSPSHLPWLFVPTTVPRASALLRWTSISLRHSLPYSAIVAIALHCSLYLLFFVDTSVAFGLRHFHCSVRDSDNGRCQGLLRLCLGRGEQPTRRKSLGRLLCPGTRPPGVIRLPRRSETSTSSQSDTGPPTAPGVLHLSARA